MSSPKNNGCSVCVFVCFVDLRHNTYNTHLEVTIFKSSKKKRTDLESGELQSTTISTTIQGFRLIGLDGTWPL